MFNIVQYEIRNKHTSFSRKSISLDEISVRKKYREDSSDRKNSRFCLIDLPNIKRRRKRLDISRCPVEVKSLVANYNLLEVPNYHSNFSKQLSRKLSLAKFMNKRYKVSSSSRQLRAHLAANLA